MYRSHYSPYSSVAAVAASPTAVMPSVQSCPHCSILQEGECVVCDADTAEHPSCRDCVKGKYSPPPTPWYQTYLAQSITASVVAGVITAVVVRSLLASGGK
jgi:hypothetical protein